MSSLTSSSSTTKQSKSQRKREFESKSRPMLEAHYERICLRLANTEGHWFSIDTQLLGLLCEVQKQDNIQRQSTLRDIVAMQKTWHTYAKEIISIRTELFLVARILRDKYFEELVKEHTSPPPKSQAPLYTTIGSRPFFVDFLAFKDNASNMEKEANELQMSLEITRVSSLDVITSKVKGEMPCLPFLKCFQGEFKCTKVCILEIQNLAKHFEEIKKLFHIKIVSFLLFMGACSDPGEEKLIFEYPPRGVASLQSLLAAPVENIYFTGQPEICNNLSFHLKIDLVVQVVLSMAWFHALPTAPMHLYLSPLTVLLGRDNSVKISNYGFSCIPITEFMQICPKYDPATFVGYSYLAPELLEDWSKASQASDVYSFGSLLYFIFTHMHPWHDVVGDNFSLVHKMSGSPSVERLPASLGSLIKSCWDPKPEKRPTFEKLRDLLVDGKTVKESFLASIADGDQQAVLTFFKPLGVGATVTWPAFLSWFCNYIDLQMTETSELATYLKLALQIENTVSSKHFSDFLAWFGPLQRGRNAASSWLEGVEDILTQPWFYGQLTPEQSGKLLGEKGSAKNCFLVRYSRQEGNFTLSVQTGGSSQVKHSRICPSKCAEAGGLVKYIYLWRREQQKLFNIKYEACGKGKYQGRLHKSINRPGSNFYFLKDTETDETAELRISFSSHPSGSVLFL